MVDEFSKRRDRSFDSSKCGDERSFDFLTHPLIHGLGLSLSGPLLSSMAVGGIKNGGGGVRRASFQLTYSGESQNFLHKQTAN